MAGQTDQAIASARQVLLAEEDFLQNALRWNDYVIATIASLEGDKERLIVHRNKVAEGAGDFWGNRLNLKLLDSLIRHFGQPDQHASSNIDETKSN